MNKTQYFFKKHSSTILTVMGIGGVVGTTILAVKATPKALKLLEEAKKDKGDELTPVEAVKVAWKPYIPSVICGFSTIACILGANYLNIKNQASLMSAYALLNNSYQEYKEKAKELHGEDAEKNISHEIVKAKSQFEDLEVLSGNLLFYDNNSMRFFEASIEHVMSAECAFLESLTNRGYACLNEYYDFLGIPHVDFGYQLGWFDTETIDPYNCKELQFKYETVEIRDGQECWIISTNMPPATDYIF